MEPELHPESYIFCTIENTDPSNIFDLKPLLTFQEKEGITLIIEKEIADKNNIKYEATFNQITLTVHSSLEAVGLTAAFANKLSLKRISANVVAAYYHDHIFVQEEKANEALMALYELQAENK